MKNDASKLKADRLASLKKQIQSNMKEGINLESVLDWCEINFGLTREKATEYIELLCRVNNLSFNENKFFIYKTKET